VAAQETKAEQLEREHEELFHELRATIPGAEVLFAFLLTVAFTNRFDELTPVQRDVYYSTFLCSATALVLLLAPSAYHRVQFRRHDKENMLRLANKEALAGTILIAFSITGAAFLITDLLFASKWASLAAGVLAALAAALWWALPLSRRLRDRPQG
jgi:predicted membrane channel-forming protein YqfA (hemolysin III family)